MVARNDFNEICKCFAIQLTQHIKRNECLNFFFQPKKNGLQDSYLVKYKHKKKPERVSAEVCKRFCPEVLTMCLFCFHFFPNFYSVFVKILKFLLIIVILLFNIYFIIKIYDFSVAYKVLRKNICIITIGICDN